MAVQDWHSGKILILWTVTAVLGVSAIVNPAWDDPFPFLTFVSLAVSAYFSWQWLSARESVSVAPNSGIDNDSYFDAAREQLLKVAHLAMHVGLPPNQANSHYRTIVAMYGQPAVDYVAATIAKKSFAQEFEGLDQLAALDRMSKILPDPELEDLMRRHTQTG